MTPFVQQMLGRRKELDENISAIQQKLLNYPDGKLICTQNGKYIKWYHSDGHNSQRRNIGHFVWKNLSVNNEQQKHTCDVIAT